MSMKLRDFLEVTKKDFDVADTYFNTSVTCCYIEKEDFDKYAHKTGKNADNYYRFCQFVYDNVEVDVFASDVDNPVCKFTSFVEEYYSVFRDFASINWYQNVLDNIETLDDFNYEWIKEIHSWLGGYVTDKSYKELTDALEEYKAEMEKPKDVSKELELLNKYLTFDCETLGSNEVLAHLIGLGGTEETLLSLGFDAKDIKEVIEQIKEQNQGEPDICDD